jgi:hypothetical protein
MRARKRTWVAAGIVAMTIFSSVALDAQGADAFSFKDPVFAFAYHVDATTQIKKLNQTIDVKGGTFKGYIDLATGELIGAIKLPPAAFTFKAAGILPLITATAQIVPTKNVLGTVDLSALKVTATSVFNINITSAYATGTHINLVGKTCTTSTPVSVTMSGTANLGGASTFAGTFTLPKFKGCGTLVTPALNQLLPGPGNTFSAAATPA